MANHLNEVKKKIAPMLNEYGVEISKITRHRSHYRMYLLNPANGKSRFLTVSVSPSDRRAMLNLMSHARHTCRSIIDTDA